jgi:hypothetical protein
MECPIKTGDLSLTRLMKHLLDVLASQTPISLLLYSTMMCLLVFALFQLISVLLLGRQFARELLDDAATTEASPLHPIHQVDWTSEPAIRSRVFALHLQETLEGVQGRILLCRDVSTLVGLGGTCVGLILAGATFDPANSSNMVREVAVGTACTLLGAMSCGLSVVSLSLLDGTRRQAVLDYEKREIACLPVSAESAEFRP